MKKLLSILLAVAMILACAVPVVAAEQVDLTEIYFGSHCNTMTCYEGGYGAIPSRYQCDLIFHEKQEQYSQWFEIAYGDPAVSEWPTEVGSYTVTFEKTTAIEGAGDTEYTFDVVMDIVVLELPATSGKCGDNMTWNFDTTTDTLTISGTGDMYPVAEDLDAFWSKQYTYEPGWWYLPVKHIVVEEGVENLSNFAFVQNWNTYYTIHETLRLPSTLKAIPEMGFVFSTAMKSLVIPEGITSLTGWPFGSPGNSFTALEELSLPSTLTELDPITVVLSGMDNRTAKQTLETIRYAGTQEQWQAITWVESESLKEIFGDDYAAIREFFAGPAQERLTDMDIRYEPKECPHQWLPATCTEPKTCSLCKETEGKPAGHTYDDNVDGTCNGCGVHRETTENRTVMHMFRMYDPNSGEHFYTGSTEERENLVAAGWHYEGVGFTFSMTTGAPVYRLYDRHNTFEHLYTMDVEERDRLVAEGWELEGIAFNSAYDTEVPQYRLHNPNETRGAYHFTASEEERDNLIAAGWEYQGIGFYSSWK